MPGDTVRIALQPLGETFEVPRGTPLQDVLFAYGVEFPCGGRGRCKRCRVKLLEGALPVTPQEAALLSAGELAEGWRLACHARADVPLTLEIAQWDTAILADDSTFEFTPGEGLAIAVDLGTTTLVGQLLDLSTGHVLAVRTALNPQAVHGSDIMSRVQFGLTPGGAETLTRLIRERMGTLIAELAAAGAGNCPVRDIAIVGNTVMHHLFCGIDVEPLSHVPFETERGGLEVIPARALGWDVPGDPPVRFLPCLGGFVGSDILAGILATKMHESAALIGLIDLGTNGEIVFGSRERIVCASAAAGPAFEAGRISMGMRAATGAIAEVEAVNGELRCRVLGNVEPRGICGSGLVDAAAAGLELGAILPSGRLANGERTFRLAPPVALTQGDIRELQLAKAAVAAGIQIVLKELGAAPGDVERLYLAGAFGNYVNRASARRIGLIGFPDERVKQAGNTALLGAKLALFDPGLDLTGLLSRVRHISLASDAEFQEIYVGEMGFPQR
ncbi:MAG TPA: ASKHA domain-containing protein [Bryobacteraceae bacterium]|nr:ASKHA domain-containing protein [Bryobacteraceae bacterium]HOL70232.1 ASKHA domain-containing protein [Bryobacteraceae bacterium]HOQ45755.1 ASKHA domain-containing protein [Bryobacteraceae bacterium]HPQ13959.1 ASKHA domain-containing protein [Bryobacteraceae bacterium]HPU71518.1 ASKHA domain-containing protein [Bryobacteraceae bacterium]